MKKLLITFFTIILFNNCWNGKNRNVEDSFYTNTGEWDLRRIPLIAPLELTSTDKATWGIKSFPEGYDTKLHSIGNIKMISYIDEKYFLIRSIGSTSIKGHEYQQAWYTIDLNSKKFEAFVDYKALCDSLKIKNQIQIDTTEWISPDSYYKEFVKTKKLPWISINNN